MQYVKKEDVADFLRQRNIVKAILLLSTGISVSLAYLLIKDECTSFFQDLSVPVPWQFEFLPWYVVANFLFSAARAWHYLIKKTDAKSIADLTKKYKKNDMILSSEIDPPRSMIWIVVYVFVSLAVTTLLVGSTLNSL